MARKKDFLYNVMELG